MKYNIVSINKLVPLEKVFSTHLKNLEQMINEDGFILKAIIADKKTGMVLDGSHRYAYFLKNGFKTVPVCWVNYEDEDIRVGSHLAHRFLIEDGEKIINKDTCINRALNGNLFEPRTTRHFFPFRKTDISLPLSKLKRSNPINIDYLIADVDISFEIAHNKRYIKEINEELEILIQYLEEVSQTKRYLTEQINQMDLKRQVVFFPGKFHPPHIGQIQTILKIIPKYRKVIIGVSEHLPDDVVITTPSEILSALEELFLHFDNVELCLIKGTLVNKKDLNGLPEFDLLLSGNTDVLNWAKTMGLKSKFIERSSGIMCSGTEVRRALKNE